MRELRECLEGKLHATSGGYECLCGNCCGLRTSIQEIDAYERDLVARIEAMREPGFESGHYHAGLVNKSAVLALIQGAPAVKEPALPDKGYVLICGVCINGTHFHDTQGKCTVTDRCECTESNSVRLSPAVKESLTTAPHDERPARDALEYLAHRLITRSVTIFAEDGKESPIGCAVGIVGDEILAMLSDTDNDRVVRALEGRK